MPRGGSKLGERRGGRKVGSRNKPKGEQLVSESDIVPPGEQGKLYVGPVVGPDDHKARPKPVIDGEAGRLDRAW